MMQAFAVDGEDLPLEIGQENLAVTGAHLPHGAGGDVGDARNFEEAGQPGT
jgi:hypothetical protein